MAGERYTPPEYQSGTVTPIGHHSDGHRSNDRRFVDYMADGYHWERKELNGPGAMNYAFDTLALAESTAIGPGIAQRNFWNTRPVPLFLPQIQRATSGYGGVITGQLISQPLFDPYSNQFGNIVGP